MKPFKTFAMVKHPVDVVYATVRDRLAELVPLLGDVDAVTTESREDGPGGTVRLVNRWKARADVPAALSSVIRPDMLAWLDRAEWREAERACHWRIEPLFAPDRTQCEGVTRYEPAMGGRGTRITFDGGIAVTAKGLPGVPAMLEGVVAGGIESLVTTLVPRNFQKLAGAVEKLLVVPR
jgi:hypothetical protein